MRMYLFAAVFKVIMSEHVKVHRSLP